MARDTRERLFRLAAEVYAIGAGSARCDSQVIVRYRLGGTVLREVSERKNES